MATRAGPPARVTSEDAWSGVLGDFYGISHDEARARVAASDDRLRDVYAAMGDRRPHVGG
jgi:hypothetical protein